MKYRVLVSEETSPSVQITPFNRLNVIGSVMKNTHEIIADSPEELIEKIADYFGILVTIIPPENRSGAV